MNITSGERPAAHSPVNQGKYASQEWSINSTRMRGCSRSKARATRRLISSSQGLAQNDQVTTEKRSVAGTARGLRPRPASGSIVRGMKQARQRETTKSAATERLPRPAASLRTLGHNRFAPPAARPTNSPAPIVARAGCSSPESGLGRRAGRGIDTPAMICRAHGGEERLARSVLQEVAAGARGQRVGVAAGVDCQRDDGEAAPPQLAQQPEAALCRQLKIEQHDVRLAELRLPQRIGAVRRFSDDE